MWNLSPLTDETYDNTIEDHCLHEGGSGFLTCDDRSFNNVKLLLVIAL